jgi:hypothetical protein
MYVPGCNYGNCIGTTTADTIDEVTETTGLWNFGYWVHYRITMPYCGTSLLPFYGRK